MQGPEAFEYRGYCVTIDIREPQAESDTGVYMTTIALTQDGPDGSPAEPVYLCKRSQYVYQDQTAAFDAAVERAKRHIDAIATD